MDGMSESNDLGGERACWLDEVCPSCGGMGGHRAGCEAAEGTDEAASGSRPGADAEDEAGIVPPYLLKRLRGTKPDA